jgi:sporulation protein YlmC with PRC-barrel domain
MIRRFLMSFAAAWTMVTAAGRGARAQHAPARPVQPDPTPEERMARRFPQPVRVGFLVGLPVLDENSSTVGQVRQVVRTAEGRIRLIVGYGGRLGSGPRPIAIPVELVAMLGAQVAAVDMPRAEMERAPAWVPMGEAVLSPDEVIRVGLTRR